MTTRKYEIVVMGFPKCGTSALMRALRTDPTVDVLYSPTTGLEIPWPDIKELAYRPGAGRILGHKFTGYIFTPSAWLYLRDTNPDSRIVLCVRHPRKSLISWHNMHRRIATSGENKKHFAWQERAFYATCGIGEYYTHFAQSKLRYDAMLQELLDVIPADRICLLSQESMAHNMDNITTTLKDAARGNVYPIPTASGNGTPHEAYADQAQVEVPEHIETVLAQTWQNLHDAVARYGLQNSL